jgi:pimeloyl-ACP methyl ester carboxylesterase
MILTGDEDILTGANEAEPMHRQISGSRLRLIAKAGHYSPWEQTQEVAKLLRVFLDSSL